VLTAPTLKLSPREVRDSLSKKPKPKKSMLVPILVVLLLAATGTIGWLVMGPRLTGAAASDSIAAATPTLPLPLPVPVVDSAAVATSDSAARDSSRADSTLAALPDTAKAVAPDTASAVAPAPTQGFLRLFGDIPEDAIVWLSQRRVRGRVVAAAPGTYNLEIETAEFEPWERRITLRAGDTLRVRVELELKVDSL
jgi:hypothetical protein